MIPCALRALGLVYGCVLGLVLCCLPGCGEARSVPAASTPTLQSVTAAAWPVVPADFGAEGLKSSVHADLDCADCHAPDQRLDLAAQQPSTASATRCVPCHEREVRDYEGSVHSGALAQGKTGAARCRHCHGAHDIKRVSAPESSVHKLQIPVTCGRCHQGLDRVAEGARRLTSVGRHPERGIHRQALIYQGLLGAPSCVDCHGSGHGMTRVRDIESGTSRANVPGTCGKCHRGPETDFRLSIHGQLWAKGNVDVPVCTDCHTAHDAISSSAGRKSGDLCGRCHQEQLRRYLQTYHGKALRLGHGQVAICYDCHGHHAILPASDPSSTISPGRRVSTCQRCHADASPRFAAFMAHGDHTDRQHYPLLFWTFILMTGLIVGTFAAWGVHTLFWVVRMVVDVVRDPRGFRRRRRQLENAEGRPLYVRFQPVDRFCHALVIVSFLLLVATGMPLKFHESSWAQMMFKLLGGPEVAATLHRLGACLSLIYLVTHISRVFAALVRGRQSWMGPSRRFRLRPLVNTLFGPESPLPNLQDGRDVVAHMKWFFGRGPRPHFDRFTYWEKFDYLAELWGSAFIGLSGLVMWFPEKVTAVAPGWVINVAHVIHSQEALLAAGFILTFHFFNAHFRADKFPMDTVMFSGRITEQELVHERKRQYDRLQAEGRLGELADQPEWPRAKWIYGTLGVLAVYGGVALVIAILWSVGKGMLGG